MKAIAVVVVGLACMFQGSIARGAPSPYCQHVDLISKRAKDLRDYLNVKHIMDLASLKWELRRTAGDVAMKTAALKIAQAMGDEAMRDDATAETKQRLDYAQHEYDQDKAQFEKDEAQLAPIEAELANEFSPEVMVKVKSLKSDPSDLVWRPEEYLKAGQDFRRVSFDCSALSGGKGA